jgi:hypothetical protein
MNIEFKTLRGNFIAVKLPIKTSHSFDYNKLIGKLSELTDEQAAEIVDEVEIEERFQPTYKDYEKEGQETKKNGIHSVIVGYTIPLMSLKSLMNINKVYTENPLGEKPNEDNFELYPLPICFEPSEELRELNKRRIVIEDDWNEAQEKTGDWLIFQENDEHLEQEAKIFLETVQKLDLDRLFQSALDLIYETIDSYIEQGQLSVIDKIIKFTKVENFHSSTIPFAFLVTTFAIKRSLINSRPKLVSQLREHLKKCDADERTCKYLENLS